MPVIKSAIKKLGQDKKKEARNDSLRRKLKDIFKNAKKGDASMSEAFSVIDKAAKNNIIHKNKAARLKATLAITEKTGSAKPKTAAVKRKTSSSKKTASGASTKKRKS